MDKLVELVGGGSVIKGAYPVLLYDVIGQSYGDFAKWVDFAY